MARHNTTAGSMATARADVSHRDLRTATAHDRLLEDNPDRHELQPPALFLAAEQDHLVPSVQQAQMMVSLAPRATLRVLQGHGHICLIAPDIDLLEILTAWRKGA